MRLRRFCIVLCCIGSWLAWPAAATPLLSEEVNLLALINQARAVNGVGAVVMNDLLREAALGHSTFLAQANAGLSHVGAGGSSFIERVQDTGYTASPFLPAELLALGTPWADTVVNLWLGYAPYSGVLLAASATEIGIGLSNAPGGTEYWTALLNPVRLTPTSGGGGSGDGITPVQPLLIDPSACTGIVVAEDRAMCLINEVRLRTGHGALSLDTDLSEASRLHNQDMFANDYFLHTGSDGSNFADRIVAAGYDGLPSAELQAQALTADAAVQRWLDSAPHRDVLLGTRHDEFGIDFLDQGMLWTIEFGTATAGVPMPTPATGWLVGLAVAALCLTHARRPHNAVACCNHSLGQA